MPEDLKQKETIIEKKIASMLNSIENVKTQGNAIIEIGKRY